ncbi:MAG: hypothetical protein A3J37_03485 [Alphaproteobacteria bacterium RIFCSPHIGHO2_12_FULL_45_9]|nr:MAG: hypothetical protein A3B66_05720 [Alphaproteobacteria bacterium RIFCSPHIGHO2_02_FULL_46_13]OFW96539.1 MAG: hypothetical protein A3J37_03485 [Alphaproteobacteria bacterium RIFCSPHIGHO2_12_FULL_45_9]
MVSKHRKLFIRGISLCDQVFFSGANFLFTIILAKFFSEIELAAYGIALSIAMTLQGVQRTSYVVQNSLLPQPVLRRRARKLLGQQLVAWAVLFGLGGVGIVVTSFIWGDSHFYWAIVFSSVVLTLIYIQLDFDRILMIKYERFVDPLVTSAGYLVMMGIMFFVIPKYHIGFDAFMVLIGIFTLAKSSWLLTIIGKPDLFWGWRLMKRDTRRYLGASLLGVAGYAGYTNFPIFILGAVAAPIQSAAYAGMRSLMQPLLVIVKSLDIIDKNFFPNHSKKHDDLRGPFFRLFALYGGGALLMTIGMALFGEQIVRLVYGEKYAAYSHLLVGWGLIFMMLSITSPIETVIVKLGKINQYNLQRIPAGIIGVILSYLLCADMGAWGAIIACLAGWVISVGLALWLMRGVIFPRLFAVPLLPNSTPQ